jgi:hypothetical protein
MPVKSTPLEMEKISEFIPYQSGRHKSRKYKKCAEGK